MSIPDRKPDREFRLKLEGEGPVPTPQDFVEMLTAEGFSFDSTVCPILLREPKNRFYDEATDEYVYQQWDQS